MNILCSNFFQYKNGYYSQKLKIIKIFLDINREKRRFLFKIYFKKLQNLLVFFWKNKQYEKKSRFVCLSTFQGPKSQLFFLLSMLRKRNLDFEID